MTYKTDKNESINRKGETARKGSSRSVDSVNTKMRINRALALSGFGSRRKAEELVTAGRVKVNSKTISDLASQVDLSQDRIEVDGTQIKPLLFAYYALYKPRGVVTTMADERGRECVADLMKKLGVKENVKPVGRLDKRSEGLLILTNDGALAAKLTHPSAGVKKRYQVSVDKPIPDNDLEAFLNGIQLSDGLAKFDSIELHREHPNSVTYTIVVSEGRNRLIRRVLGAREYVVKRLVRVEMGGVRLVGLYAGQVRKLTDSEVTSLKQSK